MTSSHAHINTKTFFSRYGHVVPQMIGLIEQSISASWITSPTHSYQNVHGMLLCPLCTSYCAHHVTKNSIMVSKNSIKSPYLSLICSFILFFCEKLSRQSISFCVPLLQYQIIFSKFTFYTSRLDASPHNLALNDSTSLNHNDSARLHVNLLILTSSHRSFAHKLEIHTQECLYKGMIYPCRT